MFYRCLLIFIATLTLGTASGQLHLTPVPLNFQLERTMERLRSDSNITADSAYHELTRFNSFPVLEAGKDLLFTFPDSLFGDVPVKVHIPQGYNSAESWPMVLLLHGATAASSFEKADAGSDLFYRELSAKGFVVVRPVADPRKRFDWVVNRFSGGTNETYNTLLNVIKTLKGFLNIDDNRVYVHGFSDGGDGAFMMDVLNPGPFAGFAIYNSMLTNLSDRSVFLHNAINRPLYLVHSDMDELRPVQQTRRLVQLMDSVAVPVTYKEYNGYKHADKHLGIDLPLSISFLKAQTRNPVRNTIYWEAITEGACDWMRIIPEPDCISVSEHQPVNSRLYDPGSDSWTDEEYFTIPPRCAVVSASYVDNTFTIKSEAIKEIILMLNPEMVSLQNPVKIIVNGKTLYNQKIIADKDFLINTFKRTLDRKALYLAKVSLRLQD